jgi:hypothetical protein
MLPEYYAIGNFETAPPRTATGSSKGAAAVAKLRRAKRLPREKQRDLRRAQGRVVILYPLFCLFLLLMESSYDVANNYLI